MLSFLALALGACSPDVHAVCKQGYQTVDVQNTTGYTDCILCHSTDCTTPEANSICFPTSRSCAVCGSPTVPRFGPGYTLTITPHCLPSCTGDVYFDSPLYFVNTRVTIRGGTNLRNIVARQCPLFIFQGSNTVTMDGLNITCETNSMCAGSCAAPAIYFSETTQLTLIIGTESAVQANGNAKSVVLVDGGIFSAGQMDVNMDGSFIGDVHNNGMYRQEFDVVLGNYYGKIDARQAQKHTRFLLQPAQASAQFLSNSAQELITINYALYTNTFGVVYEVMFDEANIYGFMNLSAEYNESLLGFLAIVNAVFLILTFFTINDIHDLR